jgi:hypothetical protein
MTELEVKRHRFRHLFVPPPGETLLEAWENVRKTYAQVVFFSVTAAYSKECREGDTVRFLRGTGPGGGKEASVREMAVVAVDKDGTKETRTWWGYPKKGFEMESTEKTRMGNEAPTQCPT